MHYTPQDQLEALTFFCNTLDNWKTHGIRDADTLHSVDGMDTLQLAKKHHPDLILMDIQLPEI